MAITIAFIWKDKIYHSVIQEGKKITIGSGKKDTIQISDAKNAQVTLKYKASKVFMNAKEPIEIANQEIPLDMLTVLNEENWASIYVGSCKKKSDDKVSIPYNSLIKIGRSSDNNVILSDKYVSRHHLVITSEAGIIRVEDQESTNGVYVNGRRVKTAKIHSGDIISVLHIQIKLINSELFFENIGDDLEIRDIPQDFDVHNVSIGREGIEAPKYQRSPRTQEQLPYQPITLAAPPSKPQKFEKNRGIFTSFLGTGAMLASSMAMGAASPALLAARAASMVSPVASMGVQSSGNKGRKRKQEEYERQRKARYGQYIEEQKAKILSVASEQRNIITRENPSPSECVSIVKNINRNLWERTSLDRDFLDVRIGMGYEELCVPIKSFISENNFQMENDEIKQLAEDIIEETRIVDSVPARLKLKQYQTIGIIGHRQKVVNEVRNILIALSTAHFYQDVKIIGIFDEGERGKWSPLRWLPHVWDENAQTRFLAFSKREAHHMCDMLSEMLEDRIRKLSQNTYGQVKRQIPHFVIILGSKEYMQDEIIMNKLIMNRPEMGITTLFLFDEMYALPAECQFIVDMNGNPADGNPYVFERDKMNQKYFFTIDEDISMTQFDTYCRNMSAIQLEGFAKKADVPDGVTFLQGYGVNKVEQLDAKRRWVQRENYDEWPAPIGVMAGNKTFALDIENHGWHGLVAGTTGSGKSELLQTWILSMAVNYHPYEVAFVIIDYKGGGMANLLEDLPHVVGKITNIDSNINRSLISLHSEIHKRERIFSYYAKKLEVPINSIGTYQRLYREGKIEEPLPRLIIVADEFAELKKEKPEVISDLVNIARVGRSLGIRLILATQKPGGIVDDQIQANTGFRICLRVQTTADSHDMLKKPDAAYLTRAGRAYVQVGQDEIYELFQSYWSGAPYLEQESKKKEHTNQVCIVTDNGMRISTGKKNTKSKSLNMDELAAISKYLVNTAEELGIQKLQGPWLPELPKYLELGRLLNGIGFTGALWGGKQKWLRIPVGMYDMPDKQKQGVLYIDFKESGHLGIYGAPSTGKTTLLKTIMLSLGLNYTPNDVQIYVIDCGGWTTSVLDDMPHVGGVALDCEEEKIQKLEKILWEELEQRKKIMLCHHVNSLESYRKSVAEDMPALFLVIDNLPVLFELYPDIENLLITMSSQGATYGMYLIYTSNTVTGVKFKVMQNIKNAIALELTDKGDYPSIVGRLEGMTLPNVRGRAFAKGTPPVVFQTAMYINGEDDVQRTANLKIIFSQMNACWKGKKPQRIPVMPSQILMDNMLNSYEERTNIPLGIGYDDIQMVQLDMSVRYGLIVSGTQNSGKSKYLSMLVHMIHEKRPQDKLYIFDGSRQSLSECATIVNQYGVCSDSTQITFMLDEIVSMLTMRKKAQMKAQEDCENEFDEKTFIQNYEQICVFIDDLKEFVDSVENQNRDNMERIVRLADHLGVLVFAAGRMTDLTHYNEIENLTRSLINYQNGIVMDGSPALYSFFHNNLSYDKKSVELQKGDAYFFENGKCRRIKVVEEL